MKKNYNNHFHNLVKLRLKIIRPLLFLTIVPYFCFIGVIAFKPEEFSPFIFDTNISLGIFLGLLLILLIFVITLIYVYLANKFIEPKIGLVRRNE